MLLLNAPDALRARIRDARRALSSTQGLHGMCQKFGLPPWDVLALEQDREIHIEQAALDQLLAELRTLHPGQTDQPLLPGVHIKETTTPIGDRLRERREALKTTNPSYSLRQVAERVGLPPTYLSQIENNKRPPDEKTLYYLADEYQLDVDALLARANLVPRDVQRILLKRPALFARLIRALERTDDTLINEMIGLAERRGYTAHSTDETPTPSAIPVDTQAKAQTNALAKIGDDSVDETLRILETGRYEVEGKTVSIAKALEHARANTLTYPPESLGMPPSGNTQRDTQIEVTPRTTLAALEKLIQKENPADDSTPVVLNFADAYEPSEGFRSGHRGQEQSLQYASGLLACLESKNAKAFYNAHRDATADLFHSDHLIYSPAVPVFRNTQGGLLPKPYLCAFISATAVLKRQIAKHRPDERNRIVPVMYQRILQILACAQHHGHSTLVLGAWGCGAYGNSASFIAQLFHDALCHDFKGVFERVVFAVPKSSGNRDLESFRKAFEGMATAQTDDQQPARQLFAQELLNEARQRYLDLRQKFDEKNPQWLEETIDDLNQFASPTPQARNRLWHQLWTTHREAGVLPGIAAQEIKDLNGLFDDYNWFSKGCWDIGPVDHPRRLEAKGECARHFVNRTGNFAGKRTDGNLLRLARLVQLARTFKAYFDTYPEAEALHFLTEGNPHPSESARAIEARLAKLQFADYPARQRLMFRMGLPVLNPNLALARAFLAFGWFQQLFPDAPRHLFPEALLETTGRDSSQYHFIQRETLDTLQAFVEELLAGLSPEALRPNTGNEEKKTPIQEFMCFIEHYDRHDMQADFTPPPHVRTADDAGPTHHVGHWNDHARTYYLGDDDLADDPHPVKASVPFLTRYCSARMRNHLRIADVSIDGVRHLIRQLTKLLPDLDHTVPTWGPGPQPLLIMGRASIQAKPISPNLKQLKRLTPVVRGLALGLCAIDGQVHFLIADKLLSAQSREVRRQEWQPWEAQAGWCYHHQSLLDRKDRPIEISAKPSLLAILQWVKDGVPERDDKQRETISYQGRRLDPSMPKSLQLLVPRFADDDLAVIDTQSTAIQEGQ